MLEISLVAWAWQVAVLACQHPDYPAIAAGSVSVAQTPLCLSPDPFKQPDDVLLLRYERHSLALKLPETIIPKRSHERTRPLRTGCGHVNVWVVEAIEYGSHDDLSVPFVSHASVRRAQAKASFTGNEFNNSVISDDQDMMSAVV